MKRFLNSWGGVGLIIIALMINAFGRKQQTEPWTDEQLLEPTALANTIRNEHAIQPKIFCVGPGALIPNSIDTGPAKDRDNLVKLKAAIARLPKDADLVIYCGCCPFERCPNVRPAFSLLNEMKFTHAKLLNIPHNLKTDWIDKGFPVTK
jgi:thiosulfate/3-mercaptopyruvate sulfurtransferase